MNDNTTTQRRSRYSPPVPMTALQRAALIATVEAHMRKHAHPDLLKPTDRQKENAA